MTAKRALLIGSQTSGLTGVHSDVEVMDDALTGLGFTTTRCIEAAATYDGIVAAYRGLIEDTSSGDAAVVYYSGHGGRMRNALTDSEPGGPTWLQHLVPTDFHDRSGGRFRAVLAEELSLLQLELTGKTANVTTILDCCHSARMSRDTAVIPKAVATEASDHVEGFPWADVDKRWSEARGRAAEMAVADANPLAVRLVACSPDESAYELAASRLGGPHGALTAVLVPLLTSAGVTARTWRDVVDAVRPAVMDMLPQQRPELEGPLHRLVFSTDERSET
ncbi:MAG TPA: caspase family protein, partial [Acidimicrobiales bacterium]|nr:caspase family protein [Acidimicrobiales bacterium]